MAHVSKGVHIVEGRKRLFAHSLGVRLIDKKQILCHLPFGNSNLSSAKAMNMLEPRGMFAGLSGRGGDFSAVLLAAEHLELSPMLQGHFETPSDVYITAGGNSCC